MQKRTKRLFASVILFLWIPVYCLIAARMVSMLDRPPFLVELAIYIVLGCLWVFPLKPIFKGIGR